MQPSILRAFGWRFALVLTKDWYHNPDDVLSRIEKLLQGQEITEEPALPEEDPAEPLTPAIQEQAGIATPIPPGLKQEATTTEDSSPAEPPPVPAPAPAVSAPAPGAARHFEFIGGASRKFWEISQSGNSFTVRFGRIGTVGQSQTKTFADEARAKREAASLIGEKLKKGYVERPG